MTEKEYRAKARENLTGNWGLSIGVAAVACLLAGVGSSFLPDLTKEITPSSFSASAFALGALRLTIGASSLWALVQFIVGGPVEIGYCQYLLNQYDRRTLDFSTLFSRFDDFTVGFCQKLLRGLYTALWSLLLVVPGVMAAYSYAMTPYILAEHKGMTASQAIAASKAMMKGHRWELFCLDLTFIGWAILASLPLNLGHLALNPYKSAARAAFYRQLSTHRDV